MNPTTSKLATLMGSLIADIDECARGAGATVAQAQMAQAGQEIPEAVLITAR